MDNDNMIELMQIKPQEIKAQIKLLGEYDANGKNIIRDPYCVSLISFLIFFIQRQ